MSELTKNKLEVEFSDHSKKRGDFRKAKRVGEKNNKKSMKPILKKLMVVSVLAFFLWGCTEDPDHSIRIKNQYSEAMSEVKVNSVSYGQVETGATTGYKPVDEGNFTLSGATVSGLPLTGSGTVTGKGTHKWTLTITSAGGVTMVEDK
jgi:hypothetical protein